MSKYFAVVTLVAAVLACALAAGQQNPPHQANGVKIGEATQNSVIVWTRLTQTAERNIDGVPFPRENGKAVREKGKDVHFVYEGPQLPEGLSIEEMKHSVPGALGETRIVYWPAGRKDALKETPWLAVNALRDFTRHFRLTDLTPGTRYEFESQSRTAVDSSEGQSVTGSFRTAPAASDPARIVFTVVTGQGFHRRDDDVNGHRIYPLMLKLDPNFFAHTGDILYFDKLRPVAHTVELARLKWNRIYALPFQRDFHNNVSSYFEKDDHDTWQNDCWPTQSNDLMRDFTFAQGQALFLEQVPMSEKTYRTFRWGKDLQIWLVEGRDYRSPNTMPDGPRKSMWGREQKEWFKRTVQESDATFRILISPTPIVGPDREAKHDNHANTTYATEGKELREFISQQKNMVIICGDRHWQYVTVDPETSVREYSTGPTSDAHAGGFRQGLREPMHQYLKIKGGFLSGTVERLDGVPTLTFRHHGVTGEIYNEDILIAQ